MKFYRWFGRHQALRSAPILVCAIGIRKGRGGHGASLQPGGAGRCVTLGLTTHAKIKRNALIFKAICVPGYIAYVLVCVYALNGARDSSGLLAAAGPYVRYESLRLIFGLTAIGWDPYERIGNSGNGRPGTLLYSQG